MSDLEIELKAHYTDFQRTFRASITSNQKKLQTEDSKFYLSYKRMASLNAWRLDVLPSSLKPAALEFVLEAQNDGVSSLAFAGLGAWRIALQLLRSMIENVLMGLYFGDHPVELLLWEKGKYKIGAGALFEYFEAHPQYEGVPQTLKAISVLRHEYDQLSRAVHGRAPFRMTRSADSTVLLSCDASSAGAYFTRQREAIRGLNLLFLCLVGSELTGTKRRDLRLLLASVLPSTSKPLIKATYSVTLP